MIVLDTDVLAVLAKSSPDEAVMAWVGAQRRGALCTTAISEAELAGRLALLPKGRQRDALGQAVARLLGEGLGGRVLVFDRAAAAAFGALTAKRQIAGHPITTTAAQIAAIASIAGASLIATGDIEGFQGCGVPLCNPWKP